MGVTYTTATGATYVPLNIVTATGSSSSQVVMSSIPQTYTDLVLIMSVRTASAAVADSALLQVGNGSIDTGTNYSRTRLLGTGSVASSANRPSVVNIDFDGFAGNTAASTEQGLIICHFQNYANTTTNKTILARSNAPEAYVEATVGLWRSTAAINSSQISTGSTSNISSGSTFALYGITGA